MNNMYYDIRHLKDFRKLAKAEKVIWSVDEIDGHTYILNHKTKKPLFKINTDIDTAIYICDLHNLSDKLIKHAEKTNVYQS